LPAGCEEEGLCRRRVVYADKGRAKALPLGSFRRKVFYPSRLAGFRRSVIGKELL
jgi:hypothetical protein